VDSGDLLPINVHIQVGHEGRRAALDDDLVQGVVVGLGFTHRGLSVEKFVRGGRPGDPGSLLSPLCGANVSAVQPHAEVNLGLPLHHILDDTPVLVELVNSQEAQGAEIKSEHWGDDSGEQRADMKNGAIPTKDNDKVNPLVTLFHSSQRCEYSTAQEAIE